MKSILRYFYRKYISGEIRSRKNASTSEVKRNLLRRFIVERGIFALGIFGEIIDGIIVESWATEPLYLILIRIAVISISSLFLFLSFAYTWFQRHIVLFGYSMCYLFVMHTGWLLYHHQFSFDAAILFMGAIMVCSLFFRTWASLLLFNAFSIGIGALAAHYTLESPMNISDFMQRLFMIAGAGIGLAQINKFLQRRILQSNRELERTVEELENLSVVASNTDNAVTITDEKGNIEWVNEGFSKLTGYALDEIEGKNLDEMLLNTHDQAEQQLLESKKGSKKAYSVELKRFRKDGTFYWSLINVTPVLSGIGSVKKYITIEKDISDRKQLEEELLNANRVQRAILDGTDYAIVSTNNKGRIQTFNKGAQTLWQRGGKETEGLVDFFELFDFNKDSYRQFINNLETEGSLVEERYARTAEGPIPVRLSANVLKNEAGLSTGFLMVVSDIRTQKEAEKALKDSEANYRQLIEYGQALVMVHDTKGMILDVNKRITEILGFPKKRMIGQPLEFYLEMESEKSINNYLLQLIRQPSHRGVMRLKTVNYETVYWAYRSVRQNVGKEEQVIVYAHDISERVKAEKELMKAKTLAEETAKMKQQFLATMSHEIRTPMNAILGFSRLLVEKNLDAKPHEWAESIHLSAENLLNIINDILDFSKIEAGKMVLEPTLFSFKDVLHRQEIIHKGNAKEKGIALQFTLEDDTPDNLVGDVTRLSQVFTNLISNAVKFTPKGKVVVAVKADNVTDQKADMVIEVQDSGIGIPEDKKNKIFESFTQVQQDNNRLYGGTGLGLSIVKNIVDLMGGTIEIDSEVDRGTTFRLRITFDIDHERVPAKKAPKISRIEQVDLNGYYILLAEDNVLNQTLAKNVLSNKGVEVVIANNGEEAVEWHKKEDFDLVLMDIQMPVMDGIEATERIRSMEDKVKSNIPIIALTAHAMEEEKDAYLAKGLNEVLSKPFKPDELAFVISSHCPQPLKKKKENNSIQDQPQEMSELPTQFGPYDLSTLRSMTGADQAFFTQMIKIFIEDSPKSLEVLKTAMENENLETLKKEAHKLKSSLKTMGLKEAAACAKKLEDQNQWETESKAWLKTVDKETQAFIAYAQKEIIG